MSLINNYFLKMFEYFPSLLLIYAALPYIIFSNSIRYAHFFISGIGYIHQFYYKVMHLIFL
jgi:hypothetical protein